MSLIKMCGAVGQNVCLVCVMLTVIHSGGEAKSRRLEDSLSNTRSEPASVKGRQLTGKFVPKSSAPTEHGSNLTQEFLEGAISEHSRFFMKKLFQKYGSDGLMTFEGFEHFLENIGLAGIKIVDHSLADHQEAGRFISLHKGDHRHTKSESSTVLDNEETSHSHSDEDHDHDHDHDSHEEDLHGHRSPKHRKRKERDLYQGKEEPFSDKLESGYREKRRVHLPSINSVSEKSSSLNSRQIRGINEDHGSSHDGHDHGHGPHDGHDDDHNHGSLGDHNHRSHDDYNHGSHDDHNHGSHHDHMSHTDHGTSNDNGSESKHSIHDHEHDIHVETTTIPTLASTHAKNSRKSSRKRGRIQISNRKNRKTTETPIVTGSSLSPALHSETLDSRPDLACPDGDLSCQRKNDWFDTCLSAQEMLVMFHLDQSSEIEETQFLQLCPVLMYQLDAGTCGSTRTESRLHTHSSPCVPHTDHDRHHDHDHENENGNVSTVEAVSGKSIPGKVWGFSLLAVIIISAVGLVSVAIIPIINKVFYNHLLQFLVAVAVGALSGDALLHLIPHAMDLGSGSGGHEAHGHEDSHGHDSQAVWIGLMALSGIYGFFILERVVTIITLVKNKKKRQKKRSSPVFMDKEAQFSPAVGAKLSGHGESCEGMVMVVHPNKAIREFASGTQATHHECEEEHHTNGKENFEEAMESLTTGVIVEEGHGHGHSHEIPNSVAAVAWMVILGDGIHNFTDGLAIGAAFSSSVTGGISTSIAIFCHELPHEIGDFAVLLRTGMSIKQALVYNCVSSLLCLVGMIIGVPLGNLENASIWIFAMVGGMFIYIAFVDMLPEMTSVDTKQGEHPFCHLIFQVFGMLVGAGIMLLIAVYEHDIMSSLEP